jgi:hypothetical protein
LLLLLLLPLLFISSPVASDCCALFLPAFHDLGLLSYFVAV